MLIGAAVIGKIPFQSESIRKLNSINISFRWPNVSSLVIENEVTSNLEGALAILKGIKSIRSTSFAGHGYVQLDLFDSEDVNKIRYEVATLVKQIYPRLPDGVSYPIVNINSAQNELDKPIISYTISGEFSTAEINRLIIKYIENELLKLEGVNKINIYGSRPLSCEIIYDHHKLELHNISVPDIQLGINSYLKEYELGMAYLTNSDNLNTPDYTSVKLISRSDKFPEWDKILIKKTNNGAVFLTDVARIYIREQELNYIYRINGLNTISFDVIGSKKSNHIVLANNIEQSINRIKRILPPGLSLIKAYDSTDYLITDMKTIGISFLISLLVLLIILCFIYNSWRYILLILVLLIANTLISSIFYYIFNLNLNPYTLTATFVALAIVLGNSIIIIHHLRYDYGIKRGMHLITGCLCIVAAVSVIFFLNSDQKSKFLDFCIIIIVNLTISSVVQLFLIPALIEKIPLRQKPTTRKILSSKVKLNRLFSRIVSSSIHFKHLVIVGYILLFGIPIFMLPIKIESDKSFAKVYNASIGSEFYNQQVRPWVDKVLGGTLRLFIGFSDKFSSAEADAGRTRLDITISMPAGATVAQMNTVCLSFENYLSQFTELEKFETSILNGQSAKIGILFKKEFEKDYITTELKRNLESKATFTGLAEFSISGIGDAFSNEMNLKTFNFSLDIIGYDYQKVQQIAENVKLLLMQNPRVADINVQSMRAQKNEEKRSELTFRINDPEKLFKYNLDPAKINRSISDFASKKQIIGNLNYQNEYIPVFLSPQGRDNSKWGIFSNPMISDTVSNIYLNKFLTINKKDINSQIRRKDQQYELVVNYNFIGKEHLGIALSETIVDKINAKLPLGYLTKRAESEFWDKENENPLWIILLTLIIVFVTCSVLLNNILQALAVVTMIPVSYIGVFIMSNLFSYKFDEGGFAALIILCGLVAYLSLYIINGFGLAAKERNAKHYFMKLIRSYNSKIIPMFISVFSLIIFMLPIILFKKNEPFWYAFALSLIGGGFFATLNVPFLLTILFCTKTEVN